MRGPWQLRERGTAVASAPKVGQSASDARASRETITKERLPLKGNTSYHVIPWPRAFVYSTRYVCGPSWRCLMKFVGTRPPELIAVATDRSGVSWPGRWLAAPPPEIE